MCSPIWHVFCFLQGERNLENVTHEEAVATLKSITDKVTLVVGKTNIGVNSNSTGWCTLHFGLIQLIYAILFIISNNLIVCSMQVCRIRIHYRLALLIILAKV